MNESRETIIHEAIKQSIEHCPSPNSSEECYSINVFSHGQCAYQDFDIKDIIKLQGIHDNKRSFVTSVSCWVPKDDELYGRSHNITQGVYFPKSVCEIEDTGKLTDDGFPKLRVKCTENDRKHVIHVPQRRYGYIIPYIKEGEIKGLMYERGIQPPLAKKALREAQKETGKPQSLRTLSMV